MILPVAAQWFAFLLFSLLAVMGGLGMATTMSMFRSGIFLMSSFIGVAGLFILLSADLLGLLQVMMYIGGMLVMVMFMVLFMSDPGGSMMAGMKMSPVERLFSRGLTPKADPMIPEEHAEAVHAPPDHDHEAHAHHEPAEAQGPAGMAGHSHLEAAEAPSGPSPEEARPDPHAHHRSSAPASPPEPAHESPAAQPHHTAHLHHPAPEAHAHPAMDHVMQHPEAEPVDHHAMGHAGPQAAGGPAIAAPVHDPAAMDHRQHDMHGMDMQGMDMAMTTPVRPWGVGLGVTMALGLVLMIVLRPAWPTDLAGPLDPDAPRQIGTLLMDKYMIGFEGAGLLILLGIVGAAFIQRAGHHPSVDARSAMVTTEAPPATIAELHPLPEGSR